MTTEAIEDYLKAIHELQRRYGEVTTTALAEKMNVAPPSITGMLKKLSALKLVNYKPYHGVTLTSKGERIALATIRHHRLVERYLSETLDIPWDEVHREADRWEHVLSDDMEGRIDSLLGFPETDPHGAPIPRQDGALQEIETIPLHQLATGDIGIVSEVSDDDSALLRRLLGIGLLPGEEIKMTTKSADKGAVTIEYNENQHTFQAHEANLIMIKSVEASDR
jgi:DtxR family Mn-dependent transcriptional regulator